VNVIDVFCEYRDYNWEVCVDWMPTATFGMATMFVSQVAVCSTLQCEKLSLKAVIVNDSWWVKRDNLQHHEKVPPGRSGGWSDWKDIKLCNKLAGQ
jgi:hypothetical protein